MTSGRVVMLAATIVASFGLQAVPARADDPGRRACYADAQRLCRPEMQSLSRRRVELCLWTHLAQTTPVCDATILQIRAQRQAAALSRQH